MTRRIADEKFANLGETTAIAEILIIRCAAAASPNIATRQTEHAERRYAREDDGAWFWNNTGGWQYGDGAVNDVDEIDNCIVCRIV